MSSPARRLLVLPVAMALLLSCAFLKEASKPEPGDLDADAPVPTGPPRATPLEPEIAPAGPLAFPGAAGWAAFTPGGRGGKILRVTTLAASGSGSLADAVEQAGPRIVVFEVGGVIDLRGGRINVKYPYLTIAGQTAPSPGITAIRGGLHIKTHDVVIRHLRVRPGAAGHDQESAWEVDGISSSARTENLIVDHCSLSWATDENLSASGPPFDGASPAGWRRGTSHRVTFSNNIVAEGLSRSTHSKGEHSKGTLIHDNATRIAVIGNLFISNMERNPLFKGGAHGIVVNNLVHNMGQSGIKYGLQAGEWEGRPHEIGAMAVVGNVVTYGPSTRGKPPLVQVSGAGPVHLFLHDNVAKDRAGRDIRLTRARVAGNDIRVPAAPLWPAGFVALPAAQVREHIEKNVGARPWDRDATDARLVKEALSGGGKIIDSESEVGGYPALGETRQPFDPDEWDLATMERKPR